MKKMVYFCIFLLVFTYFSITGNAAGANTPADAVTELMDGLKNLDVQASVSLIGESIPENHIAEICGAAAAPVLSKLEYTLGNSKITGNRAIVDISVTAADIKSIAGDILSQAIGYAAIGQILGVPVNVEDFVLTRINTMLDDKNLTTIKTNSTVHLILGGDGEWKLDMTNIGNLGFLEALSGGMADFEEPLKAIISAATDR